MPKLPKGLYRRGSRFYVRLYEEGGEVRRSLGANYEDACRQLRLLRMGLAPQPAGPAVKEVIPDWLESVVRTGRNPKGYGEAVSRARRFFEPFLGKAFVKAVTVNDLRAYRVWLEVERGLSPASVAYALGDARSFFFWCQEAGLIERAPVPRRLLPRIPERPPDRLSDEEAGAVSAIDEPYGFVVRLALATGLRWGELTRAERREVRDDVLLVGQTKSGRIRRVPLPRAIQEEMSRRIGRLVPFTSVGPFSQKVRLLSGVERFHAHMTRHTFACQYLERGGSLHVLQQILGHGSVLVTQRYARLSDRVVLEEFQRLDASRDEIAGQTGTKTGTPGSLSVPEKRGKLRRGKEKLA